MIPQHLSKSCDHYTPSYVVEAARSVLGGIDLDPASCARAQQIVRAGGWIGLPNDALDEPWLSNATGGAPSRTWINPPGGAPDPRWAREFGSRSSAVVWWRKLLREYLLEHVHSAIFLGFNLEILQAAQSEEWPDPLHFPFCVPDHRIRFDVAVDEWSAVLRSELDEGVSDKRRKVIEKKLTELAPLSGQLVSGDQPTHGNIVVGVGVNVGRFVEVFSSIGACVVPSELPSVVQAQPARAEGTVQS